MPPIRRAFARAMACAVLLASAPAGAQNLLSGKVTTGAPTFVNDQNVPLQLDATGALKVSGGGQTVLSASSSTAGIAPTSSAGGTSILGKASAANLYGFSVTAGATAGYLALINASAAPAPGGAITPLECIPVAANGYVARRQDIPDRYSTGLVAVMTSACSTYTAVTPQVISLLVQ